MKLILLTAFSFYLLSCSSTETRPKVAANRAALGTADRIDDEKIDAVKPEIKVEDKPVPQPVAASMYSALNNAVKSQNDELIQKASSEILTQNPKDVRALNVLGLYHYRKGNFQAAQFLFSKAISFNPNVSELYGNLGLVELAKGDRRDAIKTFRRALELNPQDAIVGANLGSIYIQEKDFIKALLSLEIPIKKGMKDYKIMNNYAIALVATGKSKEAADIYENLLKDKQGQREVMLNYSILLIETMKKYKEGLDLLNRLKFVGAPAEARDTIKNLEFKAKAGLQ